MQIRSAAKWIAAAADKKCGNSERDTTSGE